MAKYEIVHQCGHTNVHQIVGPTAGRDRKAEYLATTLCAECYYAQRAKEREAASATAADVAKSAGLPALTGSVKQIAWAETIRAEKIKELDDIFERINTSSPDAPAAFAARDVLRNKSSAKYWIDTRIYDARDMLWDTIKAAKKDVLNLRPSHADACAVS